MHCTLLQVRCGGWLSKPALVVGWRVDFGSSGLWKWQWWRWILHFVGDSIVRCALVCYIGSIVLPTIASLFLP